MSVEQLQKAMHDVSEMNETKGIKVQGGKKYTQVVNRVEAFRKHFGFEYGFETEIKPTQHGIIVTAYIKDTGGRIISMGNAYATAIRKEKALEKLETTAIGRALAGCGLGGGEYASLEEINSYEERYEEEEKFQFTRDHKIMQRDFLYGLSQCETVESVTSFLKAWEKEIKENPIQVTGVMTDAASNRINGIKNKIAFTPSKFGFIDVKEALDFTLEVKDKLENFEIDNLSEWFFDNDHKLKAVDVTLGAQKYQTDEGTPYQRMINAYNKRIQTREAAE